MGWLFRKKKVPNVPFPEGHFAGEGTLRFPALRPEERIIEPSRVKEAVGLQAPSITEEVPSIPSLDETGEEAWNQPAPVSITERMPRSTSVRTPFPMYEKVESEPLFVKVDVYQHILGELDSMKIDLDALSGISKSLETSEYNEEDNFAKLKRTVRAIHDRLLQVDKTLFKSQGD